MKLISQNKLESSSCHLSRTADSSCSSWFPLFKKKKRRKITMSQQSDVYKIWLWSDRRASQLQKKKKCFIFSLGLFESRCNDFTSVIILTVVLLIPGRIEELIPGAMVNVKSQKSVHWQKNTIQGALSYCLFAAILSELRQRKMLLKSSCKFHFILFPAPHKCDTFGNSRKICKQPSELLLYDLNVFFFFV